MAEWRSWISSTSRSERLRIVGTQIAFALAVIGVWWVIADRKLISPLLVPAPSDVARELPKLVTDGRTWRHLRVTAIEIAGAFVVSMVLGFGLGFWAGLSEYRTRLVEPLLISGYMVPIVLLYPVALLIFGIGAASKIAFAGLYGFFPVALNTMRAFRSVDDRIVLAAQSMGATRRALTRYVLLPAARPLVISGVRIGAALNLIGVIVGEMLGSRAGLGYEIVRTSQTFVVPKLYAYIIVALLFILLFNQVVTRREQAVHHDEAIL